MDINKIKSQFPIFSNSINGKPLIYLDSSNSLFKKDKSTLDTDKSCILTNFSFLIINFYHFIAYF